MTMTEDLTHILVFRTNINTEEDKNRVREIMMGQPLIEEWNVALDDIDRVLRIVSHHSKAEQIINLLNLAGYQCHELE